MLRLSKTLTKKLKTKEIKNLKALEKGISYKKLPINVAAQHITNMSDQRYSTENSRRYRSALLSRQNFSYFGDTKEIDPIGYFTEKALEKFLLDLESSGLADDVSDEFIAEKILEATKSVKGSFDQETAGEQRFMFDSVRENLKKLIWRGLRSSHDIFIHLLFFPIKIKL